MYTEEDERIRKTYILSDDEHEKVLGRIVEDAFDGKRPVDHPHLKFILSQTGGGKSGLTASFLRKDDNYVIIDSDKYKSFRDDAEEIASKHPTKYGFMTWFDCYKHRDEVFAKALAEGYNILIEIAPSMPKGVFFDISNLPEGYEVDFELLAVSPLNSLLSTRERFELQISQGLSTPKLTDIPRHEDSFEALSAILLNPAYSHANKRIFIRAATVGDDPVCVYPMADTTDQDAVSVLLTYQGEDTLLTLGNFGSRHQLLRDQMDARQAPTEQYASLDEINARFEKIKSGSGTERKLGSYECNK